jgi:hypothetical protein
MEANKRREREREKENKKAILKKNNLKRSFKSKPYNVVLFFLEFVFVKVKLHKI